MDTIRVTATKALANPMHVFETIVKGFCFAINWDPRENWFHAVMSFDPGWSHTNHIYAHDITSLEGKVQLRVSDAMRLYTNGGKFTEKNI